MNVTPIEWTTFSANPLKYRDADGRVVWACVHASPGCVNCYAESIAKRWGSGGPFNVPTTSKLTPFLDDAELHHMLTAKTIKGVPVSGSMCFVGDMTDLFGEWVPDALLDRLFAVFALRRDVIWQVLTKRADRMRAYLSAWTDLKPDTQQADRWDDARRHLLTLVPRERHEYIGVIMANPRWPLPNVWLGVSCENQQTADERIPSLLQTPAAVRFISAEPLIGPIRLVQQDPPRLPDGRVCWPPMTPQPAHPWLAHKDWPDDCDYAMAQANGLSWVIVGGESGPGARPCRLEWVRSLVQQCRDGLIPAFVKQLGAQPRTYLPPQQDLAAGGDYRLVLNDRKGGDPSEWPEDLCVRQFPSTLVPKGAATEAR